MCGALLALTACSVVGSLQNAPSVSAVLSAPQGIGSAAVLGCAASVVEALERKDDRWDTRITRNDVSAGVLETGDFPEENVSGFRLRVAFSEKRGRIDVAIKSAGAYFVDLGGEEALAAFRPEFASCLQKQAPPRPD